MVWIIVILLVLIALYIYVQNRLPAISRYTVTIPGLHKDVKRKKILQISDVHLKPRYNNGFIENIISQINTLEPDLIVITGDLVNAGLPDFIDVPIRQVCEQLSDISPTYFVTGNHDIASGKFEDLNHIINTSNVRMLVDEAEWVSFGEGDAGIVLMGMAERREMILAPKPRLQNIELTPAMIDQPKILLAHHPEYFEDYLDYKTKTPDLTLSGHTHAGQVRIPILGGFYSPGQGFLPKYDYGMFSSIENPSKRMIISRGVGNSSFPFRINNRPEIVLITLN